MLELISLEEAYEILMNYGKTVGAETIILKESLRRVLAEDLTARISIPPFNRATVDGYGISTNDPSLNEFVILGEIPAGYTFEGFLGHGQGLRIFTGAPVAKGINAVIRQEDVTIEGDKIIIQKPWKSRDNIAFSGEDVASGEPLVYQGTAMTPGHIGLLAAQGISKVPVFRQPRIGLLSTGDELVPLGEPLPASKIYDSNLPTLLAFIENLGGIALDFGVVPDSLDKTSQRVEAALSKVDLLVTTGGASVGDYDQIKEVIAHIGGEILFWKVAIKPGTPIVVGTYQDKLIIGLSGNPAAAMITAELLLAPLLRKISGHRHTNLKRCNAVAHGEVHKPAAIRRMLRVQVQETLTGIMADIAPKQKSGIFKSLAESNGVIDLEPGKLLKDEEMCEVILFNKWC